MVNDYPLILTWFNIVSRRHTSCNPLIQHECHHHITAYTSACKSLLYQDMLEKPSELLLYRPIEKGGLGLFHVQSKSLIGLIATFLQTAANDNFQNSLYHSILYRYYCLLDQTVPELDPPPYYSMQFFNIIRDVVENSPLNPVHMSQKQWYRHLLEKNVTMEVVDAEDRMVPKKSKAEERDPELDWQLATHVCRMKGLSPDIKSFNFKLVNLILPSKERISQLLRNSSPICTMCATQVPETVGHALFECDQNSRAARYLLDLSRVYDSSITKEKVLKLQVYTEPIYELPTIIVLYSGLYHIWRNRI